MPLLDLLCVKQVEVTPYYIINSDRKSTGIELAVMTKIKRKLWEKYPDCKPLLKPTKFVEALDIPTDKDITAAHDKILQREHIGDQYEWLAKVASYLKLPHLELGIHKDDRFTMLLNSLLVAIQTHSGKNFHLKSDFVNQPEYIIFKYFRYPLLEMSKLDMRNYAIKHGFENLLHLTWFCHEPTFFSKKPCGTCLPCVYAIQEGMGYRIPLLGRFYYQLKFHHSSNKKASFLVC